MIPIKSPALRFCLNVLATFGLFWLFLSFGWFELTSTLPLWAVALIVSVLSGFVMMIFGIASLFILPLIAIAACLSMGLVMFVFAPAVEYGVLWVISWVTGLFTVSTVWWQALVIGLTFAIIGFKAPSSSSDD